MKRLCIQWVCIHPLLLPLSAQRSKATLSVASDPQTHTFSETYDSSFSNMKNEHKYKDKDEYKDNDKDKDAERITESLTVCYIFGILVTQAFQV